MIQDLIKYRNLIEELVIRDIKKKYRRSVLGILWSMLNPILMMLITAMVFSNLFRFDIKNFALYLLTGQIIFTFYAEATNFAMGSILENGALIKKVYIPKYLFPLSRVASSGVNLCFTLPAMLVIMLYTGQPI
ncbi:ABC transporter permease, partial [Veillonella seminalis]